MVVIFHEVTRLASGDYTSSKNDLAKMKNELNYTNCNGTFPDNLTPFKTDLNYFFDLKEQPDKVETKKLLDKRLSIAAEKFEKSNCVIDYNANRSYKASRFSQRNTSFYTTFHKDVDTYFCKFNIDFYLLKWLKF